MVNMPSNPNARRILRLNTLVFSAFAACLRHPRIGRFGSSPCLLLASSALLPLAADSTLFHIFCQGIFERLLLNRLVPELSYCSSSPSCGNDRFPDYSSSSDSAGGLDECKLCRSGSEGSLNVLDDGSSFGEKIFLGLDMLSSMGVAEGAQPRPLSESSNEAAQATAELLLLSSGEHPNLEMVEIKGFGEKAKTCGRECDANESVETLQKENYLLEKTSMANDLVAKDAKSASKRLKVDPVGDVPTSVCLRPSHIQAAWEHWRKLKEPKLIVAPMVDQSELPFRMLCRKYGATAAYTPMLHARLFAQDPKYRSNEFTTCPEDRPLFVQFCANNPNTLLEAARIVEPYCDYVDINLGCPQRIAKRGNYGAFLMDDLPIIRSLVTTLATNLSVPVSCKIRLFPCIEETLSYARMLEGAGCSLLAVHGRTRDQKDSKAVRADWDAIRVVKNALHIPVLANGNIRWLNDVQACLSKTGADGVLSAESLLENPALFAGYKLLGPFEHNREGFLENSQMPGGISREASSEGVIDPTSLLREYLNLCEKHPVPPRMIRAHVHRILGNWFKVHPDLREEFNKEYKFTFEWLRDMMHRMCERNKSLHLKFPP